MYMDNDGMTLATEILAELKASARRWFIAFLVMVVVEICTVAGFLWYISLPIDEVAIENDEGNALYLGDNTDVRGGVYNGANNKEAQGN